MQGRDDDAPELDLLEPPPPADPVAAAIDVLRRKGFARLLVDGQAIGFDELDLAALARSQHARGDRRSHQGRRRGAAAAHRRDRGRLSRRRRPGVRHRARRRRRDGGPLRHVFSERFECRRCGIVYEVPQPRLFSFNNPFGACPTCHGFGNVMELDMGLVVPDPTKTLQRRRRRAVDQAALPRPPRAR